MNFDEAIAYMESLIPFGWKLGNERFEQLCALLGNPHERYSVVHVAGTKGKGSTTALTASILQASGLRVGSYFSPYVYDVSERVQADGVPISGEDFARLVTQIRPHMEALSETEFGQTTEFELKTLVGFLYFAERKVDIACIEVGIGGRLDATNVVHPTVCVITNIGLDHTHILGDTHDRIAAEKAGIIKPNVPCITATEHPDAFAVIAATAVERGAALARVTRGDVSGPTADMGSIRWNIADRAGDTEHEGAVMIATEAHLFGPADVGMPGLYQRSNAACAVAAAEVALGMRGRRLTESAVRAGLTSTRLPGRFTIVRAPNGPLIVLDGAHNPMAAAALAGPIASLRENLGIGRLILVVGMLTGHEPDGLLAALCADAASVYVCQPNWKRAMPAEELAAAAIRLGVSPIVVPGVKDAVSAAIAASTENELILVTGSFYTVGEVTVAWLTQ